MNFQKVLIIFSIALINTGTSKTVTVTRDKPRRLDISCKKKGAVISTIDVISGSNTKQCCVGKTPQMIVDALNCYWKTKCSLSFPTDIVIMPQDPTSQCPGCIGSPADFIVLKEARCFAKTTTNEAIVDICDENGRLTGNISMDSGILRSHPDYPWQYNSNSYPKFSKSSPNHVCKRKLWLSKKTNIVMTVQVLDIAEGDYLNVTNVTMNDEVTTETITSNMTYVYFEHKSLEFTFGISQGTNGGMGFLICFKRFQTGNYDRKTNACDELMKKEVKIRKKKVKGNCPTVWGCRSKKGSKRRKGDRGKKNGGRKDKKKDKNSKMKKGIEEAPAEPKTKTNNKKRAKGGRNRNRKTRSKHRIDSYI